MNAITTVSWSQHHLQAEIWHGSWPYYLDKFTAAGRAIWGAGRLGAVDSIFYTKAVGNLLELQTSWGCRKINKANDGPSAWNVLDHVCSSLRTNSTSRVPIMTGIPLLVRRPRQVSRWRAYQGLAHMIPPMLPYIILTMSGLFLD